MGLERKSLSAWVANDCSTMGAMTRASVFLCLKLLLFTTISNAIEVVDDDGPSEPSYAPSKNYINHAGGGRSQSLIQYYHDPPTKTLIDHSALDTSSSSYPKPRPLFSFNSGFRPIVPSTLRNLNEDQPPVTNYGADLVRYDVDQNNKFSNPIHVPDEESTEQHYASRDTSSRDTSSSAESHVYEDEPTETYTEGNSLSKRYSSPAPSQKQIQPRYSMYDEAPEASHYGHHHKKKEVHYHKHKHIHEHKHKQDHHHKHKQDHNHDHHHDNKHDHHHGHHHDHGHKHGHHHHHGHKHHQMHKHEHHEDHKHGHEHKHKNDHHHAHKHGHKHHEDHKHGHKQAHKHDHHEDHKHENKHEHKNDHHHHHGHKHEHKHGHKHDHHNKHEHKHGHKHEHKHEHKEKHKKHHHKKHHHHHW